MDDMGRHQCKDSSNNLKRNIVTPESSEHAKGRLKHSNIDEVKEINFKCNLMKMMEPLKQEVKNSLKEMEKKTHKRRN